MRDLVAAVEGMARAHGVEPTQRFVARYVVRLTGFPEADAVQAVKEAGRRRGLPTPGEVLEHLEPTAPSAEDRAAVRRLATTFLARYGLEPAGSVQQ